MNHLMFHLIQNGSEVKHFLPQGLNRSVGPESGPG